MAGRDATTRSSQPDDGAPSQRADAVDLEAVEQRHVEELARAHAALAAAQDRSYWLDRWGVDLNALMRRPAAKRARLVLRGVRELQHGAAALKRYGDARLGAFREVAADEEHATTAGSGAEPAGEPDTARDRAPDR